MDTISDPLAKPATCSGVTRAGTPCQQTAGLSPDTQRCLAHDPLRQTIAAEHKKRGGRPKAKGRAFLREDQAPALPETLEDCKRWLSWLLLQTVTGALDAIAAREATKQVVAKMAQLRVEQNAEKRLKALEKALARAAEGKRPE